VFKGEVGEGEVKVGEGIRDFLPPCCRSQK